VIYRPWRVDVVHSLFLQLVASVVGIAAVEEVVANVDEAT
jgi:hypothetical protein